ncbi:unnamed protein product [Ectocarpus sp. 8 AP-2014]
MFYVRLLSRRTYQAEVGKQTSFCFQRLAAFVFRLVLFCYAYAYRGCEPSEPCTPPAKYAHCRYFVRLDWHEKHLVGEGGSAHAFRSVFNSPRLSRFLWLRVCRTYLLVKFCTHLDTLFLFVA